MTCRPAQGEIKERSGCVGVGGGGKNGSVRMLWDLNEGLFNRVVKRVVRVHSYFWVGSLCQAWVRT